MAPVLALDGPSRFYGRLLTSPGRVLVLGAGDGVVATALAARGHFVTAIEPSNSLRAMLAERQLQLPVSEHLEVRGDDPRTLELGKRFNLVIAPHQALGLTRTPDELFAFLEVMSRHLLPDGIFALDALAEFKDSEDSRPKPVMHLRDRSDAIHPLAPLRLTAQTLDDALASVGLEPRERYSDFNDSPFSPAGGLQVVVGGIFDPPGGC
ncbi:MAG: class I SAM-dependent methyltransferase [Archangium sp.]